MTVSTANGAAVFWTARVSTANGETRLASCRYVGPDGMAFVGDQAYPVGSEVTMFVAALHASVFTHTGWTEFRLRVAYLTFADGLYRMGCVHRGTPEASLAWLALAVSRLGQQARRSGLGLGLSLSPGAAPAPPPPIDIEARRRQLRDLLRPGTRDAPLLAYDGAFDAPAQNRLFNTARTALAGSLATPVQRRKLYTAVVELARNIQMHAADAGDPAVLPDQPVGALQVVVRPCEPGDAAPTCSVSAANHVAASAVAGLSTLMHGLCSMGAEARDAAYSELLLQPRGGAPTAGRPGFGLLTLAGESAQAVAWSFSSETLDGQSNHAFVVTVHF